MTPALSTPQRSDLGIASSVHVARLLGVTSRQVHAWVTRRATNGFPEPVGRSDHPKRGGPRGGPLHDVERVLEWWATYEPHKMSPASPRRQQAARRRAQARAMSADGMTKTEIAAVLGIRADSVGRILRG